MTDEQYPTAAGRGPAEEPGDHGVTREPASDAEDEGYDEGAGDRVTPSDESDSDREPPEAAPPVPPSSPRHLPEDLPPKA